MGGVAVGFDDEALGAPEEVGFDAAACQRHPCVHLGREAVGSAAQRQEPALELAAGEPAGGVVGCHRLGDPGRHRVTFRHYAARNVTGLGHEAVLIVCVLWISRRLPGVGA